MSAFICTDLTLATVALWAVGPRGRVNPTLLDTVASQLAEQNVASVTFRYGISDAATLPEPEAFELARSLSFERRQLRRRDRGRRLRWAGLLPLHTALGWQRHSTLVRRQRHLQRARDLRGLQPAVRL